MKQQPKTRFTLERRPSDFRPLTQGRLYIGCCCCCCFHWAGTAIGGLVGYIGGWSHHGSKVRGLVRAGAHIGLVVGLAAAVIMVNLSEPMLSYSAFVPLIFLLPALVLSVIAGYLALPQDKPQQQEVVASPAGGEEQGPTGVYRAVKFKEKRAVNREEYLIRYHQEAGAIWRVTLRTFVYALVGMLIGYVLVVLLLSC